MLSISFVISFVITLVIWRFNSLKRKKYIAKNGSENNYQPIKIRLSGVLNKIKLE